MADIKKRRKHIAENRRDSCACHIPSKAQNHNRIQDNIDQITDNHAHHGRLRISFSTDNVTETVAEN